MATTQQSPTAVRRADCIRKTTNNIGWALMRLSPLTGAPDLHDIRAAAKILACAAADLAKLAPDLPAEELPPC
jgi:hypothetical protein